MFYPLRKAMNARRGEALFACTLLLLSVLSLPAFVLAAPDHAMQQSLHHFFARGVVKDGASAELIRVEHWPDTSGAIRWSLPNSLRHHPKRFSLIAEQGDRRWYVPVRVHWWTAAIVASKPISARTLLTAGMLKKTRTDIAGQPGHWLTHKADLIGMRLTRNLDQDSVIMSHDYQQPPLIRRGDLVEIVLQTGRITIRSEGKALRNAKRGERIFVKNLRSNERIQGVAERAGVVRVYARGISG